MAFFIKTIQFLAGLSIIVGLHELGHLLFAKLFKMRVHSYMIGFPPKIFKKKYGETEYALGIIPLGGAVQIAGMIDESFEAEQLSTPSAPWEFRAKPAWQRLIVIVGGIIFNIISGILIYISLTARVGGIYLPKDEVNKYGILPTPLGIQMGFEKGDKIIKINGKDFEDFNDVFLPTFLLSKKSYYTIRRNGHELNLSILENILEQLLVVRFIEPFIPCYIDKILPHSSASLTNLQPGDHIIEVNGQSTPDINELSKVITNCIEKEVEITYVRHGIKNVASIKIEPNKGLGGITLVFPHYKKLSYSLVQSIVIGLKKASNAMQMFFLGIYKLITGKVAVKNMLNGPIGIAQYFGNEFIGSRFWEIVAYLSIALGLTQLLPIPVLDGGHVLFILYEMAFGKKPSDKFVSTTQRIGIAFLIIMIIYISSNDLFKLFLKK